VVNDFPGVGETLPSDAVIVAIIGFTINSSAYQSEYIRSALTSVDPGQLTAARAVGLSKLGGIRYVVLPQALRFAIPGWTNEFIYLIKYSSLAAFITVPELFRRARNIGSDTFRFTDIYLVVAVFYLAFVLTTAALMTKFEKRVAIPGLNE
jgi:polar amino acid transport system permease protein